MSDLQEYKHKLHSKSVWATREQLQAQADEMNITVDELIQKLQEIFYLVGDQHECSRRIK